MSLEGQNIDKKSLRIIMGKTADWPELAKDCVCFANAHGGRLLIGIEDGDSEPPAEQRIPAGLIEKVRARIGELTVNVTIAVQPRRSETTGGEYLEITVSRSASPSSTTDGRFYLRVGDACKPLVGEDVQRLLEERSAQPWETLTSLRLPRSEFDPSLHADFVAGIRTSDRVKASVKEKSDEELFNHYYLAIGPHLTNLGILCIGRREARARLGTAPVIQFIKYDETGRKVNKILWDDHTLTPMQLIDAVWRDVPDFRETYEFPDGLFRQHIPVYDGRIVRELLVNALVHRPYTQRGDIYLNLHPDRLEVVNPGLLPFGVTPQNILHQSVRRNNELARVFHDLGLMEREGSGYDLVYEVLLSQGRPLPKLFEGPDYVKVVVEKRIVKPEVIDFLMKADQTYQLRQRERIALGLLAQSEGMTARELADALELSDGVEIAFWIGRLPDIGIVRQTGRTKGTRYFVEPEFLRRLDFPSQTSLARIEPHRLDALVLEDVARYPASAIGEIHERIGPEIKRRQVKLALDRLCDKGKIRPEGDKRGRRYWPR
ncbi:ATP-binding protein [Desulfococcus sp.]|uniref:ATP-binding protein n=1 Tax=Desulfococcus sp. TaxID=2025834 RepID=UPI003594784C